ncbi:protein mono-ADP-ribosyltransferase TIPARP-like [Pangshura tecta]
MAAGSDAPAALPPARLARPKRSRRSALRLPAALRTAAQAHLLRCCSPEPGAAPAPAPPAGELSLDQLLELVDQLQYHTHPEDGVEICPHFLRGCCFFGASCPQHHTLLPYHWQLWQADTLPPGWRSVGPEAHETLERLYSDPERTLVRASYQ